MIIKMQNIRACEGATKVVLRGKHIASNSYIRKGERLKNNPRSQKENKKAEGKNFKIVRAAINEIEHQAK